MKKWITDRTFLLILFMLCAYVLAVNGFKESWGFNKTVNWAWDVSNMQWWLGVLIWIGFMLGYALLAVFKVTTNIVLSSLQLLLLICTLIILRFYGFDQSLVLVVLWCTNGIFILNMVVSIRHKLLEGNKQD